MSNIEHSTKVSKGSGLDDRTVLGHLEAVADNLGVEIRYEPMEGETPFSPGGMCRIRGKQVLIINAKAPPADQIATFVKAFSRLDLSQIYLRPGIRKLLEGKIEGAEGKD
ncbi:MAG: hypothetical protein JRL30_09600 [Deltaproteobacteria bacterium]|nr:hypothetical protein [Deltaproteobacteria bacterium]